MSGETPGIDAELDKLQRDTFGYFVHETNAANGLVIDKTAEDRPASIAATGLALAAYPVGVERGFLSRSVRSGTSARDVAILVEQPARPRARRNRLPRLLLSLSRHADRPSRLAVRTVDGG